MDINFNTSKIPAIDHEEKIKVPFKRERMTFIVTGIFDNGACYTKKKVVLMAYDESEARVAARRHLEKYSDDCFKIDMARKMTEDDVIVEVM
jgi:hypothetical protein